MSNTSKGIFSCRNICWIVGALLGLVAWILIGKFFWGLLVGIVLAIAVALVLQRLFCTEAAVTGTAAGSATAAAGAAAASAASTGSDARTKADATREAAEAKAEATDAEAAREAAEAKAAKAAEAKAAKAAETKAAKAAETAAAREKAEADATRKAAAAGDAQARADAKADAALAEVADPASKDYDGDGVLEGEGEGSRPEALTEARAGKADDLKLIKGIGPKLEQLCNGLGFYHWDQIAGWTADEVAWVNANLKGFKGRVSRDNWVEQAKVLAAGGTTEFAERAEESGMYDDKS